MKEEDSLDFDALLKKAFFVLNSDAEKALKLFFDLHDRKRRSGQSFIWNSCFYGETESLCKAIPFWKKRFQFSQKLNLYR